MLVTESLSWRLFRCICLQHSLHLSSTSVTNISVTIMYSYVGGLLCCQLENIGDKIILMVINVKMGWQHLQIVTNTLDLQQPSPTLMLPGQFGRISTVTLITISGFG